MSTFADRFNAAADWEQRRQAVRDLLTDQRDRLYEGFVELRLPITDAAFALLDRMTDAAAESAAECDAVIELPDWADQFPATCADWESGSSPVVSVYTSTQATMYASLAAWAACDDMLEDRTYTDAAEAVAATLAVIAYRVGEAVATVIVDAIDELS